MDVYDFATFLAYAIAVFVLASCLYRKHVQRTRVFYWGLALFIGGLILSEVARTFQPSMGFLAVPTARRPQPSMVYEVLSVLGRWTVYASVPVFFLACSGSTRIFARCSRCGYDLTGNDSGVCPECGGDLRPKRQP